MNSFETPAGVWHFRHELGGHAFGILTNQREPSTPSVSSPPSNSSPLPKSNGNPLSNPMYTVPAPPPPLFNAKLSVVNLKVPVTPGKGSKSRDTSTNDMPPLNELNMNGSANAQNDELSPLPATPAEVTPVKRRGLVSLNSLPLVPSALSFQKDSSANTAEQIPRPKASIRSSSSTFVLRVDNVSGSVAQANKSLVQAANQAPTNTIVSGLVPISIAFWTQTKSLLWCDVSVHNPPAQSNQCRVSFAITPTCLSVNTSTASTASIDLVIGFPSGDLIWLDPLCGKYNRLNKSGVFTASPVTALAWVPTTSPLCSGQGLCFVSAHADGSIFTWSTERDDPAPMSAGQTQNLFNLDQYSALDDVVHWTPPPVEEKKKRPNPVLGWKVSRKAITDVAFDQEGNHLAVVTEAGSLRLVDCQTQRILDTFSSYFGAFTTVNWSPDSRFILTGGQDDLISIFSLSEQRLLARCQGHTSYVGSVSFEDPTPGAAFGSTTDLRRGIAPRFASVGDDGRLVLWDLSGAALHRPKHQPPYAQRRVSLGSTLSLHTTLSRRRTLDSNAHLPLDDSRVYGMYHDAPSMKEVAALQPVSSELISNDLLTGLAFISQGLVAVTRNGLLKIWQRPEATGQLPNNYLARGRRMPG